MAELVVYNPHAELEALESSGVSVEHETGVPVHGYSSGYATTSSENRTPKIRPKISRASGDSVPQSERTAANESSTAEIRFDHHPLTGQIEPPGFLRKQPRPLLTALKRLRNLDATTRKRLKGADEFIRKGKFADAIPCLEAGLVGADEHPRLQSLIWMLLGNTHVAMGQYKKASVCHMHHLAFCRELADFPGMTKAECNLGIAYMKLGLLKLAGRCFLQYMENSKMLQDEVSVASACSNLGMLSKTLATRSYQSAVREGDKTRAQENLTNNLQRAISYFEQHLEVVEGCADLEKQARAYGNLGSCYEILKQFPQAIFCHNKVCHNKRLELVRTAGDPTSECCALCNLGNCFRATGRLQEALEYYLLDLELTRAIGNTSGEVVCLLNLGTTCELLNKLDKAIEWHTLYLSMMVQRKDLKGQARAFSTLAGLYEETKQLTKAHEYYKKLVEVFQQMGDKNAHSAAAAYLEHVRQAMRYEKSKAREVKKGSSRRRSKSANHSNTISKATGINVNPRKRSKVTRNKIGTWSHAQGRLYQANSSALNGNATSTLVLENPRAHEHSTSLEFLTLASQPDRVYQYQGISQRLFEQETLLREPCPEGILPVCVLEAGGERRESNDPLPNPPNKYNERERDSLTDYESMDEEPRSKRCTVLGSQRHIEELQRVERDFMQPVAELGLDGTDREWEQWLQLQDDDALSQIGSLNIDMSVFGKSKSASPLPVRANFSAPTSLELLDPRRQPGSGSLTPTDIHLTMAQN